MARLQLKNINKRWGSVIGVDDFNLDIADEEFLVLLGPSGCGKSTTMRMIAGLESVSDGEIWFGDTIVNNLEPKDRDISMVFQSYGLYPHLTVYENIRFPLRVRKVPKEEHHKMVMKAIQMMELEPYMDRRPADLSGGQRQRVALGRSIVRRPRVFLMDEPLSNLDAKLRVSTRAQIKNLQSKLKTTTVYVTHDQIEAMTLADRVVVMNGGKIQQVGIPSEIYNKPANTFVASFIGSPAMNLIEGEIKEGTFSADGIQVSGFPQDMSGSITLGFRAEDARVLDEISEETPQISDPIYSIELLGEAAMVSWLVGGALISVKANKDYQATIGQVVSASIEASICHLFDTKSGIRIDFNSQF